MPSLFAYKIRFEKVNKTMYCYVSSMNNFFFFCENIIFMPFTYLLSHFLNKTSLIQMYRDVSGDNMCSHVMSLMVLLHFIDLKKKMK